MSEKKQLNEEQLNKVSGGINDEQHAIIFTICFYNADGVTDQRDVTITYTGRKSSVTEKEKCERWCIDNNYSYISHVEKNAPSGQIVA